MNTPSRIHLFSSVLLAVLGTASTTSAIHVTYQVDMSVQMALGEFFPGTDTVFVSGNFSNPDWQSGADTVATNYLLTPNAVNPNIYEGAFAIDVAVGGFENHKFVLNRYGDFSSLQWESIGNRFFQVPATDTNLAVVFFDDLNTLPSSRNVTFQVDMSGQIASGNFDPWNDFVNVAGSFNHWSTTASTLFPSVNDTNIWEGTFRVTGLTGAVMPYRFLFDPPSSDEIWEHNGVGPNGPNGDREMVLSATDTNLPVVCFNNECSVPPSIPVTFQVNMAAQMAYGYFVEGVNIVAAAGQFNNWNTVSFVLTNNSAEPTVYKGTTNVSGAEGSPVSFQYVIDEDGWEMAVGNRTFNLTTNHQTLDTVFWNNVDDLGPVHFTPVDGHQVEVSWSPGVLVRLQQSTNLLNAWVDVPTTTGESNTTVRITTNETYFRLIGP